jgi:excinuclease UvrABC helicase subunit UvrB
MTDEMFLYADEAVDYLAAALDKARQAREIALVHERGGHIGPETVKNTRRVIHNAIEDCQNAVTALQAARGEL